MTQHYLFTDPACMGHYNNYFSDKGDMDDIVAIIAACQMKKQYTTIVICCDNDNHDRYNSFMDYVGNNLKVTESSHFIKESELTEQYFIDKNFKAYLISPIKERTANILSPHVSCVYRQGDDTSYNFVSTPWTVKLCSRHDISLETHTDTFMEVKYDNTFRNTLSVKALTIYDDLFNYKYRKMLGFAFHIPVICERLYSNDGGINNSYGSGIKPFVNLINKYNLNKDNIDGLIGPRLLEAFCATNVSVNDDTIFNCKCLLYFANLYTDFETLLVDDKIPNLKTLGKINKRQHIPPDILSVFEDNLTTPLHDFVAIMRSFTNIPYHIEELYPALKQSLYMYSRD